MGNVTPNHFALLLGLSLFFGFAFERFYASGVPDRPGGIRTFPLLALLGALLYMFEPQRGIAFSAGLLVLGALMWTYYRARVERTKPDEPPAGGLMIPTSNMLAYTLGPVTLTQPAWLAVGVTVVAVLLLAERERLHHLVEQVRREEILTLGQFLILSGIVLPLLPDHPVTTLTAITPHQAWLAVVVVSSLSYASYLGQRYLISPERGTILAAALGGLYSSTATTVVLARRAREESSAVPDIDAGIVLATGLMYLRMLVIVAVFSVAAARALAPALLVLFAIGIGLAAFVYLRGGGTRVARAQRGTLTNPLELSTALAFAALFVIVSLASTWVRTRYGQAGIYTLAAIVGVTDIDPFVLSMAQGSAHGLPVAQAAAAILIAASSNNVLKGVYAAAFAGTRRSLAPITALAVLTLVGCAFALVHWRMG